MNVTSSIAAGMIATALVAAQDYPHAFPREGVKKLFENERLTAWEVVWKKNVAQPIHRHRFDMAAVYLRYGPIRVTSPDGKVAPVGDPFPVPRPFFQPKGVTHKEEAIGFPAEAPERMAIMFDLKDVSHPAIVPTGGMPTAFPRAGAATPAIDNARVLEWDYTWEIGRQVPMHLHGRDSVSVFSEGGTIKFTSPDGKVETKTFAPKDTRFITRGTIDSEEAVSGHPRAVTIELK